MGKSDNDKCVSCSSKTQLILTPDLTSGDGTCIDCSTLIPGCDSCDPASRSCLKCKEGLYLFDNGGYTCTPCDSEYLERANRNGTAVCSIIPAPITPNITLKQSENSLSFKFRCPAGSGSVLYMIGLKSNVSDVNATFVKSQLTGAAAEASSTVKGPFPTDVFYGKLPYSTVSDEGEEIQISSINLGKRYHVAYFCLNDIEVGSEMKVVPLGRFVNPEPEITMKEKEMEVWIPVGVSIFIIFFVAIIYVIYLLVKKN